jgi:hypothetical protein
MILDITSSLNRNDPQLPQLRNVRHGEPPLSLGILADVWGHNVWVTKLPVPQLVNEVSLQLSCKLGNPWYPLFLDSCANQHVVFWYFLLRGWVTTAGIRVHKMMSLVDTLDMFCPGSPVCWLSDLSVGCPVGCNSSPGWWVSPHWNYESQ